MRQASLRPLERHRLGPERPRSEPTGLQRRLQLLAGLAQLLEPGARVVLASSSSDRRARRADERRWMERPLEKGHIA